VSLAKDLRKKEDFSGALKAVSKAVKIISNLVTLRKD
jgi:hypothetical protein